LARSGPGAIAFYAVPKRWKQHEQFSTSHQPSPLFLTSYVHSRLALHEQKLHFRAFPRDPEILPLAAEKLFPVICSFACITTLSTSAAKVSLQIQQPMRTQCFQAEGAGNHYTTHIKSIPPP